MKCYNEEMMKRLDAIYKETEEYTRWDFVKKIDELRMIIKQLRGEVKAHSSKSHERYKAIKGQEKRIKRLNLEAQRWFDLLMDELYLKGKEK